MPKVVNHDERRAEIISAAWRLIADEGLEAVTTRRIAETTGYSNGSLRYYFPGKDAVMIAAFQHVFDATNIRANRAECEPRGLAGLRSLCVEIMPLDELRRSEAKVAIAFWQQALGDPQKTAMHSRFMNEWRDEIRLRLTEAEADGEVAPDLNPEPLVDELLSMMVGLQILSVLSPLETGADRQTAQYEALIARLVIPANQI